MMSDFDDIPAAGDVLDEQDSEDDVGSESSSGQSEPGKYRLTGRNVYVTWSKSKINDKDEFHQKLLAILPAGVRLFGGRELHQDGTPHYHAVLSFVDKVHWTDAVKKLSIEGDTNAIRLEKPRPRQRPHDFLENTMAYCAKDGDTFGERILLEGAAGERKKRKWQEIIDEADEQRAWQLVRELDPRAYMLQYPALQSAMCATKRGRFCGVERRRLGGRFRVPKLLDLWMEKYVVHRKWSGRPMSLVIIGDPMVGKSAYAESYGNPIVMNSGWCLKAIFPGATHLVVSDSKPSEFGYAGKSYWRDVLGGQDRFNCRDFQQETRTVEWGLPCVWTCNFDNDPRNNHAVAEYMKRVSYVVEIRDRPGQKGWGKLYVPEEAEEELEDADWREAVAEVNDLADGGCVDEAIDLSNEFGI